MKIPGVFLPALFLVTEIAAAQSGFHRLPSDGATIGDLVRRLPKTVEGQRRPQVIKLDATDDSLLFPAAGSVQGAGGTYFRSDVTLINHRSVDQRIAVGWIAAGVDNTNAPLQYFVIPANTPVILADFVGQTLGQTGLGAVLILGVDSNNANDSLARLDGFSRIWTYQPGASGTVSQGFPSVSLLDSIGSLVAYALGNRHDSQYRTNVGVVNLDSFAHTWTVGINGLNGSNSFAISVLPISMRQSAVPAGNYGDLVLSFQADGSGFAWSGYGSTVDNVSGDSWSAHASQP